MPEMNANDASNTKTNHLLGTYDDVFVDTNILIYANLTQSPFHQQAIQILETLHQQESTLWLSRQILREYLSVMTKRE